MNHGKRIKRKLQTGIFLFMLLCGMNIFTFQSGAAKASPKVELNKTKVTTTATKTVQLRLKNAKGTVVWKSSNRSVAKVSQKGKVYAISKGTCRITAKYKGRSYRCTVKVYNTSRAYLPAQLKKQYIPEDNQGRVILAGSSSLEFWTGAASALAPYDIMNMGVSGTTVSDWERYYSNLIVRYNPEAIVLYVGSNDIGNGIDGLSGYQTAKQTQQLIQKIRKKLPDTLIYYVSICPTQKRCKAWADIRSCNRRMEKYCAARQNLYYVDLESYYWQNGKLRSGMYIEDGLHPSEKAYRVWGKRIRAALKKGNVSKK